MTRSLNIRSKELKQTRLKSREVAKQQFMFISSLTHEARAPLNSIIGYSGMLLKEWHGSMNPEQKENLSAIIAAGKRLHSLMHEVADIFRIEAGEFDTAAESFDVHDLLEEALACVESGRKNGAVKFKITSGRYIFHTNRRRLLQCVSRLLSNASTFTSKGTVSIKVKKMRGRAHRIAGMVEITVTDTGVGIRRKDLPRLFSPFVRLNSTPADNAKGLGLDLYLAQKIATKILKGEIFVKSVYGRGSTFGIKIPMHIK